MVYIHIYLHFRLRKKKIRLLPELLRFFLSDGYLAKQKSPEPYFFKICGWESPKDVLQSTQTMTLINDEQILFCRAYEIGVQPFHFFRARRAQKRPMDLWRAPWLSSHRHFFFSTIFSLLRKGNRTFMKVYQCFYWTSDPQFFLGRPAILVPIWRSHITPPSQSLL